MMISVPIEIAQQFEAKMAKHSVPSVQHAYYKKWFRYYLDFCSKYHFADASSKSLPLFLKKLREKRQTDVQIKQAAHAISLYLDLVTRFNTSRVSTESKALTPVTDISTIQTLPGHSDVRTTMIYTHCVPSRTVKEAKSPLDF